MMKLKKMILIVIIFIISLSGGLVNAKEKKSKEPLAHVEKVNGVEELVLSEKVKNYLRNHFPTYWVPRVSDKYRDSDWTTFVPKEKLPPVYALADFDGNQQEDLGLFLINKENLGFVVILNQVGPWLKHYVIDPSLTESIGCRGISKADPGEILTIYGKGYEDPGEGKPAKITLKNPGLGVWCYEASSSIVYWDNGKYMQIYTSD